jgi:hypothetical protein
MDRTIDISRSLLLPREMEVFRREHVAVEPAAEFHWDEAGRETGDRCRDNRRNPAAGRRHFELL